MVVFMVVRCCSCEIFQVQQTKKTSKWTCKVCNVKQSVCKLYAEGTAADCRKHVQKLNLMQAEQEHQIMSAALAMPADIYDTSFQGNESPDRSESNSHRPVFVSGTKSRWSAFVEPHEVDEEETEVPFSEWTTSKEEFEKGKKKIRRERKNVKNAEENKSRMSGFHPVSQRPASAVTTTQLDPTPNNSSSLASSSAPVFPYTSLGAGIAELLQKPPETPLTASRSSHCLDKPIHGTYRKIDENSTEEKERPLSSSHSAHNLIGFGKLAQSSGKHDFSRQNNSDSSVGQFHALREKEVDEEVKGSKWSQFITVSEEEDETSDIV